MRLRAGPIVAGALALTAAPSGVRAELRYEAPGDCPDQAAFSAAFARRSERSLPPATRVTIVGEERAYRGVIEVEGQERVLLLDRCDELVEALALSLALQLGKRPDDRKPEPSPAKNGARDGVSPLPTAPVPPGQGPPAITDGPAPTPAPNMSPPVAQPPEDDETPWRVEAGFSLQARWGRGRVARAEPSAFAGLRHTDDWWSFDLRAAAFQSRSGELVEEGRGNAELGVAGGRLTVCPVGYTTGIWAFHPCLELEAGRLEANGKLDLAGRDTAPWVAGGLSGRAEVQPLSILALELAGGLTLPITRYRLRFETPERVVYEVPRVGGAAGGSVFLLWP